jgi:hypothetical protein
MNREHVSDMQTPPSQTEVMPYDIPEEYPAPEQQDDDSRRAFFRTIAGAAGALAVQTTPGAVVSGVGSYETAALVGEVAQGSTRARQIVATGSTVTSLVSREASVVSAEMSRRAIIPLGGIVALSSIPRSMRLLKSTLRSAMWNS